MEQTINMEVASKGAPITLPIAFSIAIAALLLGYITGVVYPLNTSITGRKTANSEPTASNTPSIPAQTVVVEPDDPSYKLSVGAKSSIVVPKGWKVTSFIAANRSLTNDERNLALTEISKPAIVPIHEHSTIVLTSAKGSKITIAESYFFALGPVGFVPEEMPADWIVVKIPVGTGWGVAKHKAGKSTVFEKIYKCEEPEICGQYASLPVAGATLSFEGDDSELTVAETMFTESFVGTDPFSFDQ